MSKLIPRSDEWICLCTITNRLKFRTLQTVRDHLSQNYQFTRYGYPENQSSYWYRMRGKYMHAGLFNKADNIFPHMFPDNSSDISLDSHLHQRYDTDVFVPVHCPTGPKRVTWISTTQTGLYWAIVLPCVIQTFVPTASWTMSRQQWTVPFESLFASTLWPCVPACKLGPNKYLYSC